MVAVMKGEKVKWRILESLLGALLPVVLQLVASRAQREAEPRQSELPLVPKL